MKIEQLSIGDKVHVNEYGEREYDGTVIAMIKHDLVGKERIQVQNSKNGEQRRYYKSKKLVKSL